MPVSPRPRVAGIESDAVVAYDDAQLATAREPDST
jgi:hypothetical protein